MKLTSLVLVSAAALALAACGSTREDRGLSGAGMGAAGGAAIGAFFGPGGALVGAAIGAGAGGAGGALTKREDIYLGEPVWR